MLQPNVHVLIVRDRPQVRVNATPTRNCNSGVQLSELESVLTSTLRRRKRHMKSILSHGMVDYNASIRALQATLHSKKLDGLLVYKVIMPTTKHIRP